MFEKLFVKTSDLVFHKIAPYAVERERFLTLSHPNGAAVAASHWVLSAVPICQIVAATPAAHSSSTTT